MHDCDYNYAGFAFLLFLAVIMHGYYNLRLDLTAVKWRWLLTVGTGCRREMWGMYIIGRQPIIIIKLLSFLCKIYRDGKSLISIITTII